MPHPKETKPQQQDGPTRQRPTTPGGDPLDGSGEDNHVEKSAPKDGSPQQEHDDADQG